MPYVRTCLQRSKSVGLSIKLRLYDTTRLQHALSFLAAVITHLTRWEHFGAVLGKTDDRTELFQSHLLSNLRLPSLQSFSLSLSSSTILGDDTGHFYQSWEMPNLRFLYVDIIPKSFVASRLSSVHFSKICMAESAPEGERLRNFISAFPN